MSLDLIMTSHLTGEGNGNPLQYSCLENPMEGGAWWAAVHGVAKSWTWLSDFIFTFHFHALRRKWQPTPVFLPGESQGWGSLVGAVYGVTQSQTRLKRLSSSSSSSHLNKLPSLWDRFLSFTMGIMPAHRIVWVPLTGLLKYNLYSIKPFKYTIQWP